jgi:hypothetical protein
MERLDWGRFQVVSFSEWREVKADIMPMDAHIVTANKRWIPLARVWQLVP